MRKILQKFLNVIQPERIWMIGLKIWNDTDLYKQYNQGLFVPLDLRSRMMEAKKILENLKMSDCIFADTTVLNKYTVIGKLPYDKEKMINWMNELAKRNRKLTRFLFCISKRQYQINKIFNLRKGYGSILNQNIGATGKGCPIIKE